jgi:hypothetical protein
VSGLWLAALLACAQLQQQDEWELIALNADLSILDARIRHGNTGWLRGQGQVRMDWLFRGQTPVIFARDGLPEETEDLGERGLRVGPDALRLLDDGTWTLEVRDESARAQLTLTPQIGGPAPVDRIEALGAWTLEAPVVLGELQGMLSAGSRSQLVDGRAVLTHRSGDDPPAVRGTDRLAVYLLGRGLTVGVDQTGGQVIAWAIVGDLVFDARDARVTRGEKGRLVIDLRPTADLVAHVLPRQPRHTRSPWDRLHALERWATGLWRGTPERRTQGARARLLIGGEPLETRAVIVEETYR